MCRGHFCEINKIVDFFLFLLTSIQEAHVRYWDVEEKVKLNRNENDGSYAQLFIYRVPKKNHNAMVKLQEQIVSKWKKHGILFSEFFQLTPGETVKGFTNLAETVSAGSDEEVWVEVQRYRDREHRDEIFAAIRKDMSLLELFGQFYGLVTAGHNSVMADFNRLKI